MLEILLGAVVVLLTAWVRSIYKKHGSKVGGATILLVAFGFSLLLTLVRMWMGDRFWETLLEIFSSNMVIFEVVVKRIVFPLQEILSNDPELNT